jgi:predicted Zn-dependent protease with MMP-like domain
MGEFRKKYVAPTSSDIETITADVFLELPDVIRDNVEKLAVVIEELPDEDLVFDIGADSQYSVVSHIENQDKINHGWQNLPLKKIVLHFFRRGLLDLWCESGEDLKDIVYNEMLKNFGMALGLYENEFDFLEDEVDLFSSIKR